MKQLVPKNLQIFFNEELHKYTDNIGRAYISTTTIIGDFVHEFDSKAVAEACERLGKANYPKGHPKYAKMMRYKGKTAKMLMYEWSQETKRACDSGNTKHNYMEDSIKSSNNYKKNAKGFIDDKIYTIDDIIANHNYGQLNLEYFDKTGIKDNYPSIYNFISDMVSVGFKIYAEIGVYNPDWLISGLIDVLFVRGTEFFILDWKTNKAPIRFDSGHWEKDDFGCVSDKWVPDDKKFKIPLNHLPDSIGNHYAMQISTYAVLVESFGYTYLGCCLAHIRTIENKYDKNDDSNQVVTMLKLPYLKAEVEAMIKVRCKDLSEQYNEKRNLFNM